MKELSTKISNLIEFHICKTEIDIFFDREEISNGDAAVFI